MDDERLQERTPEELGRNPPDTGERSADDELNVSPASPSDVEDDLPDYQPGEGPGPTPGQ